MSRVLLVTFLVVACMAAVSMSSPRTPKCSANQVFTECGSACPQTCDTIDDEMRACTLQCIIGCRCIEGYVLDGDTCVPREDCHHGHHH